MFLDILFLAIFIWAAFRGFTKGFLYQLATIAALILGILGAILFSKYISDVIINNTRFDSEYIPMISFALTFILIVVLVHLLARFLEKIIDAVALGFVNRFAGAIFSITKYAVVLSVLLVVLNTLNEKKHFLPEETISKSKMYRPLSRFIPAIFPYLNFRKAGEIYENLEEELQV